MRFKSEVVGGYQVFAVAGTNTVSFGIDFSAAETTGLLGFAVERVDPTENERYYMYGFKVFESVVKQPGQQTTVRTYDQPVQSFVWDDFTAKDGRPYQYLFHPLQGTPKNLERTAQPISISVRTEPLFSELEHDVFFNRGVASSQAYAREFRNQPPTPPTQLTEAEQKRALDWLSRQLDDAILRFIANARKGDTLLCCFYEFRYLPVAKALRKALDRGVDVRLIVDAKVNESTDKGGVFHESFPREENRRTLKAAGIPKKNTVLRQAKPNDIAHNKFMVRLAGKAQAPSEVWTGSTNISLGGIHGQTNVGHWVRNPELARLFKGYWQLLSSDPGPAKGESASDARRLNKEFRAAVEALHEAPTKLEEIQPGVAPVFSPRAGSEVLESYARLVDGAERLACITFAFGIGRAFKDLLKDNDSRSPLSFVLLEKQDKPTASAKTEFVKLDAKQNIYEAWGSYLGDPLYQWTKETNAAALALNQHVSYVHSKFLLRDPLGDDPIVVTGSANFSDASTNDNDENMIVVRGSKRVADIYFTEFNRLFNHYYFRSVQEATRRLDPDQKKDRDQHTLFLAEHDSWVAAYRPGKLKRKRLELLTRMTGFEER